jgi:hypothetical protein
MVLDYVTNNSENRSKSNEFMKATRQFDGLLQRERHTHAIKDDSSSNASKDVHDGDGVMELGKESSTADDDDLDYSDGEESKYSNDRNIKSDNGYSDTDDDDNGDEPTDQQILAAEGYAPF